MSIQSEIERLAGAKNDIATSIENQGVTVPSNALLSDMSSLTDQITGDVTSVNGQTGDVVLGAADVGALASDVTYVESVNGSSGAVTIVVPSGASEVPQDLGVASVGSSSDWARADHVHAMPSAEDVGAYVKPADGIPSSDLAAGVIPLVPGASSTTPIMDGVASVGTEDSWARGDHIHQIDITRAAADIITIQSAQPSSNTNKLWIDTNAGSGQNYQIPTVTEMNAADEQITKEFMSQLGIIIEGNSTSIDASVGQYVIVKNSTISGIMDGLYTAAQAISSNIAIDSNYLSNKVDDGGLNDLKNVIKKEQITSSTNAYGNAWLKNTNNLLLYVYANGYICIPFQAPNDTAWFVRVYDTGYNLVVSSGNISFTLLWYTK